jgi:hypothetical protein
MGLGDITPGDIGLALFFGSLLVFLFAERVPGAWWRPKR